MPRKKIPGAKRGGARPGAGAPKGTRHPKVKARAAAVEQTRKLAEKVWGKKAFQGDAVDFLELAYRNPDVPIETRVDIAGKVAPYHRARKHEHAGPGGGAIPLDINIAALSDAQLELLLTRIEAALDARSGRPESGTDEA